jgi:hypothetical protein
MLQGGSGSLLPEAWHAWAEGNQGGEQVVYKILPSWHFSSVARVFSLTAIQMIPMYYVWASYAHMMPHPCSLWAYTTFCPCRHVGLHPRWILWCRTLASNYAHLARFPSAVHYAPDDGPIPQSPLVPTGYFLPCMHVHYLLSLLQPLRVSAREP